jgi:hypothetical protein
MNLQDIVNNLNTIKKAIDADIERQMEVLAEMGNAYAEHGKFSKDIKNSKDTINRFKARK